MSSQHRASYLQCGPELGRLALLASERLQDHDLAIAWVRHTWRTAYWLGCQGVLTHLQNSQQVAPACSDSRRLPPLIPHHLTLNSSVASRHLSRTSFHGSVSPGIAASLDHSGSDAITSSTSDCVVC